jgi:hypothetical protein
VLVAAIVAVTAVACGSELVPEELTARTLVPADGADDAWARGPATSRAPDLPASDARSSDVAVEDAETEVDAPGPTAAPAREDPGTEPAPAGAGAPGPSDGEVAAFVGGHADEAVVTDHRTADATGDGVADVVVATIDTERRLAVVLGAWDGAEVQATGRLDQDDVGDLGRIALRDVDGDGDLEVVVPVEASTDRRVLVAAVTPAGELEVPRACPVGEGLRTTIDFGDGWRFVDLVCDEASSTTRDGLVWRDGWFVQAAAADASGRGPTAEPTPPADDEADRTDPPDDAGAAEERDATAGRARPPAAGRDQERSAAEDRAGASSPPGADDRDRRHPGADDGPRVRPSVRTPSRSDARPSPRSTSNAPTRTDHRRPTERRPAEHARP